MTSHTGGYPVPTLAKKVKMEPIKIKPTSIKNVKKDNQPVTLADETPYLPLKIETKELAMRACLHMILKHTADMFLTITEIIAEEYKMDSTELVKTIQGSPRFEALCADDVLLTLGYLDKPKEEFPDSLPPEPLLTEAKPKQKRKPRAVKAEVPEVVAVKEEPPSLPVPQPQELQPVEVPPLQPKKVKIRIVNKLNK